MTMFRLPLLTLALALSGLSLTSCSKSDPQPHTAITASSQQLATGSWRLDQIKEAGQVTSAGAAIKDQYSLTFRPDGTYTQKLLADNTTYNGTWMLMSNNTVLHLTDHKGDSNQYTLASLTATELRYTFTNKTGQAEERTFSAQP
ncbi:lipocalin family protein [Hymenobacter antarcticus]|uniref:Lipocalin-like domain-containing protein n=1 Tax=Hymenobacter antarcticus TaxID=486270 RepID=A0ABP7PUL5_9BACT